MCKPVMELSPTARRSEVMTLLARALLQAAKHRRRLALQESGETCLERVSDIRLSVPLG